MKSTIMSCMIGASLLVCSCSSSEDASMLEEGTGTIQLSVKANASFSTVNSRAVNESAYANTDNYTVQVLQGEAEVLSFTYGDRSASIKLDNGNYTLKAYYGTESDASREAFYVVGTTDFVVNGNDQALNVDCAPTCGKMVVDFDSKMADYFSNYYVTYETEALAAAGSTVTWAKDDTDPWYLKLNAAGETVKATVHYTVTSSGKAGSQELTYAMTPDKSWTLHIAPKDGNGGLSITITIDESTTDKPIDIVVPSDWI
ncbi:MAG: DUF4493 domain-containing protein [Bacteroides sp.]|nr:DUF4493 domain-containing protein [Bacteroides sp.]